MADNERAECFLRCDLEVMFFKCVAGFIEAVWQVASVFVSACVCVCVQLFSRLALTCCVSVCICEDDSVQLCICHIPTSAD